MAETDAASSAAANEEALLLSLGGDTGDSLAEQILHRALQLRASDIHLDSAATGGRIRMRLDGLLYDQSDLSGAFAQHNRAVISRFKILAGLDIAEHRLPQDGSFCWTGEGRRLDARLSLVPAQGGERAVIRLIEQQQERLQLRQLGLEPKGEQLLLSALDASQGLILVTGSTGSGKTTTLYAALEYLSGPQRCILSAEDPVERSVPGVGQVQVNSAIGLDFQRVLRAFLRQDPQVLMVGEMRDTETANIAIRASLTGHLVLSTLHSGGGIASIVRLREMGLENWLLASALSLIVSQRLVRRLCRHCRQPSPTAAPLLSAAGLELAAEATPMEAVGCSVCGGRGYSGRRALFEVLPVTPVLASQILAGGDAAGLRSAAQYTDFQQSAANLLQQGELSAEEFFRVLKPADR